MSKIASSDICYLSKIASFDMRYLSKIAEKNKKATSESQELSEVAILFIQMGLSNTNLNTIGNVYTGLHALEAFAAVNATHGPHAGFNIVL